MALTDRYDNPISTDFQAARDHYDRGMHLFLGAEFGAAEAFAAAVEAMYDAYRENRDIYELIERIRGS